MNQDLPLVYTHFVSLLQAGTQEAERLQARLHRPVPVRRRRHAHGLDGKLDAPDVAFLPSSHEGRCPQAPHSA